MNNIILETKNLNKAFRAIESDPQTPIIHQLNFQVVQASTIAIVGASGAGKSTLLHLLGGLEKPDSGQVLWNDCDISQWSSKQLGLERNKSLGFIYQFHHLLPEFSALDNVALPLRIGGQTKKIAHQEAKTILCELGLAHRIHHRPSELSGGERQRVAISRALVTKPRAILADEPTGNLDQETANTVFNKLIELNNEFKCALIMVTHSLELASHCQNVYKMDKGSLLQIKKKTSASICFY